MDGIPSRSAHRSDSTSSSLAQSWPARDARDAALSHDSLLYEAIPPHPLGVKPSGNALAASSNLRAAVGSFGELSDELVILLLECLDAASLLSLGATCKALYAFTHAEELWKALFIEKSPKDFKWHGTWHATYLNLPPSKVASPDCSHLFSDTLHRPFYCAHVSLSTYTKNIPARNQIPRLPDLTEAEFQQSWTNKPFILTEPVKTWPVYRDWSPDLLLKKYGNVLFRAEAVDWPLHTYIDYMNNNTDESPLYLFDRSFVEKMDLSSNDPPAFQPPPCFGTDLFSHLGPHRPDNRWLIIGPARSGSTFHKDPNATSAWNAVLRGSKYWIMFPSNPSNTLPPPPGVYVSADQSEVTSPLSIAEWLLNFHSAARRMPGCLEGICGEGEVLHVPSGWWHLVVNLDASMAITQNFVPERHLAGVLEFLKYKGEQVSGFRGELGGEEPFGMFVRRLREVEEGLVERALGEMEGRRKRKWDEVVRGVDKGSGEGSGEGEGDAEAEGGGFSFGFGDDGSDVEVP
ncbi:hypothetical protein FQN55_007429 [Onygenales sp. PD_40]|nr:hypothetical protein FQN55_007429 [Onygenales sp. PD_40]KAK2791543.1 hypothetical protein FQN51_002214 [Onygenales sp. PD_10]